MAPEGAPQERLIEASEDLYTLGAASLYLAGMDSVLEGADLAVMIWGVGGHPLFWSPAATRILGWTEADVMAQSSPAFLVSECQRADYEAVYGERAECFDITDRLVPVQHKDGSAVLCQFRLVPLAGMDGAPAGHVQLLRKVDREAQAEESEFRFRHVFESTSVGMVILNERREFWMANPACCKLLGYSRDELAKHAIEEFVSEADRAAIVTYLEEAGSRDHESKTADCQAVTRTGGRVPVTFFASRVGAAKGASGQQGFTVVQISDRSQQEDIKHDLAANNARLQAALSHAQILANAYESSEQIKHAILSAIPSILVGLDQVGCVIQWNEPAEKTFGIAEMNALDQRLIDLPITWDKEALEKAIDECRTTLKVTRCDEISFRRGDGSPGILGITVNPVLRENGVPLGVILLGADRTERLMLERQLMQAQKLESIGQLAAGIAHEINTPTQYVSDNTRYVRDVFAKLQPLFSAIKGCIDSGKLSPEDLQALSDQWSTLKVDAVRKNIGEALDESLDGLDRVATIVRAMKEFSHPGGKEKSLTDLNHCVESTSDVTRNEWKYVAELSIEPDPNLPRVPVLAGEFNQVILNMIVNAAHAIEDKVAGTGELGKIRIRLKHDHRDAIITISDTGCGIPDAIRDRIFDPFFTTKEVGKGTGQGLTLAHDVIVKRHQGAISIDSVPGEGTTFTIRLPLEEPRQAA